VWRREDIAGGDLDVFDRSSMALDASSDGRAAVMWARAYYTGRDTLDATMFVAIRRPAGTWSRPNVLSKTLGGPIDITSDGTVYVSWAEGGRAVVMRKAAGSSWKETSRFTHRIPSGGLEMAMAVNNREWAILSTISGYYPRYTLRAAWRVPLRR
jgi:hypothetical protein